MRFLELSAVAAALASGAVAQQAYGAQPQSSITGTATTTAYTTITVFRVETTVTATRNGTVATYESTSTETSAVGPTAPSVSIPSYGGNSTGVYGTGVAPSSTGPPAYEGSASRHGTEALGLAAVAGVIGLLVV